MPKTCIVKRITGLDTYKKVLLQINKITNEEIGRYSYCAGDRILLINSYDMVT